MSSAERTAAFRAPCSRQVGLGHLRRCLTLAEELHGRGWRCGFWRADDDGGGALLDRTGFDAVDAKQAKQADALVVDDYGVTAAEIRVWARASPCLAVIDDLADRALECRLIVNGNPAAKALGYPTSPGCRLLLGPRYALLRPAFRDLGPHRIAEVRRVLVTLGGSDPLGLTAEVVSQLRARSPELLVDVVVGPLFSGALPTACDRVRIHRAPADIAALMRTADLAVTAAGQTAFELAACGVPAVALRTADNQRANLAALGAVPTLVPVEDVDRVGDAVAALASDRDLRRRMSASGQALLDGHGATRVADALTELLSYEGGRT